MTSLALSGEIEQLTQCSCIRLSTSYAIREVLRERIFALVLKVSVKEYLLYITLTGSPCTVLVSH